MNKLENYLVGRGRKGSKSFYKDCGNFDILIKEEIEKLEKLEKLKKLDN